MSRIFLIILIILAALFCILIPIAIGVYVYKDSKMRGMNPLLWTLLALLAPGFIGLIIYLIVRIDHSVTTCPKCGKLVDDHFYVCPSCGQSLKNSCPNCGRPLEPDWNICPNCSKPIPDDMKVENPVKPKKDKGFRLVLALVIIIPILMCMVLIAGVIAFSVVNVDGYSNSCHMDKGNKGAVVCETKDPDEWYAECDKQGKGVYVLRDISQEEDSVTTKYLVYNNTGDYDNSVSMVSGGLFKSPEFEITILPMYDDGNVLGYTIDYYEYTDNKKDAGLSFTDDNEEDVQYTMTDVTGLNLRNFSDYDLCVDVTIPKNVSDVYSVNIKYYLGSSEVGGETTAQADESQLIGYAEFFSNDTIYYDDFDSFAVTACNKDGKVLATTGAVKKEAYEDPYILTYDSNGRLVFSK